MQLDSFFEFGIVLLDLVIHQGVHVQTRTQTQAQAWALRRGPRSLFRTLY